MKRLVTDNPQGNLENALNLFFAKYGETWVRGYGVDGSDITLNDMIRLIIKKNRLMIDTDDVETMQEGLNDALSDEIGSAEGTAALLYTAAWVCAELRARLAQYEAAGIVPGAGDDRKSVGWPSPFDNDPFAMIWKAFKNLYPDKDCTVFIGYKDKDKEEEEYGFTNFPDDGSLPQVCIYCDFSITVQAETLGHELAHVAVGIEHDHDEVWKAALDAIHAEYERIAGELFGVEKEEEGEQA